MSKTAIIKLTSAIGIKGQLVRAGEIIEVPEEAAKDLMRRGKAELATEDDEATTQLEGDADEAPEPAPPVNPAPAQEPTPAPKPGKKK